MKKEKIDIDLINLDIRNNEKYLRDVYRLYLFSFGDQWRDSNWNTIEVNGLPKRKHNKILGYINTMTSYFIQNYPRLQITTSISSLKPSVEALMNVVNAVINSGENMADISTAFAQSLIAGYSVLRVDPLKGKIRIKRIYPFNFLVQFGIFDISMADYVIERYFAKNDKPLLDYDFGLRINEDTTEFRKFYDYGYSFYYKVFYRDGEDVRVKVFKDNRSTAGVFWNRASTPILEENEVLDEKFAINVFPYIVIRSNGSIQNISENYFSEVAQVRDMQVFINKQISYADIIMGLSALGIVKTRNLNPSTLEIYPGSIIPLSEVSDIAIDRGIGLNFNYEAYNLSSALMDDVFGINEIMRGVRPASISSGVGIQNLYNIAQVRLLLRLPQIKKMMEDIVRIVYRIIRDTGKRSIPMLSDEDYEKIMFLGEDDIQYALDVEPVFTNMRNFNDLMDYIIRFAQYGVVSGEEVRNMLVSNFPSLFKNNSFELDKLIKEKIIINGIRKIIGGGNMPINQGLNQNASSVGPMLQLTDAEKKMLASIGIDPSLVTPEVLQTVAMLLQDPQVKQQVEQVKKELMAKGYTEADANVYVVVMLIKSVIDTMQQQPQSQTQTQENQPQQ